jgi:hypothetical protein
MAVKGKHLQKLIRPKMILRMVSPHGFILNKAILKRCSTFRIFILGHHMEMKRTRHSGFATTIRNSLLENARFYSVGEFILGEWAAIGFWDGDITEI